MNIMSIDKRSLVFFLLALVLTNVLLFWPDARMGYVLDDHYVIAQNPAVKQPSADKIWKSGLFASAHRSLDSQLNYYRPLLTASYALEYQIWGSSPFAQRLVNLFIHMLNGALVFYLIYLLFRNPRWAVLGALFFSVLPVHEWSVRYILGRGDLLMAFFSLLSLISLSCFLTNARKIWLRGSLLCFIAALLSKESALLNVALVFMVTFYLTKEIRRTVAVAGLFGVAAAAYYLLRSQWYPIHSGAVFDPHQLIIGIKEAFMYALRYLTPWSAQQMMPGGAAFGMVWALCCAGLLTVGISQLKDRSMVLEAVRFGIVWMVICAAGFLVTHRISGRLGPVLSEHFLYLESVGFVLLLAIMIDNISNDALRKIVFGGFVVYFLLLSLMGGSYWTSEKTLLSHVQKLEGREFTVAFEQLTMRYRHDQEAVLRLIENAKSGSTQSLWLRRLGDLYRREGKYPEAKTALARAVDLNPHNIEAINELAVCHLETGEKQEGLKLLGGSLLISSQQSDAFRLMGIVYYRSSQFARAIPFLKQAWVNDPDQKEAALYLMMAYFFINDQVSYLETVDQISARFSGTDLVLRFAAIELFAHNYFKETIKIITQSQAVFENDPSMMALLKEAQGHISALSK